MWRGQEAGVGEDGGVWEGEQSEAAGEERVPESGGGGQHLQGPVHWRFDLNTDLQGGKSD